MHTICILDNPIQTYAWGSHTAIADLLCKSSPSREPEAEMWMGAHPQAPSMVVLESGRTSLDELIGEFPEEILGRGFARSFGGRLPFLFKVLAAGSPLSIQAHPDLNQARVGFARENEARIPLHAPNRSYRDDNHKPECICALTPFWGMNGFRRIPDIHQWVSNVCSISLAAELHELENRPDEQGLKVFIKSLLEKDVTSVETVIAEALDNAGTLKGKDPVYDWMLKLFATYPGDIGGLFPAILNLVCLEPGQAMYLPAGQFHAYLKGVGIELMANSDNVLRGGLTPKHIDVAELLKVVVFQEQPLEILQPVIHRDCEKIYPTPAREFELSVIDVAGEKEYQSLEERSAEILLVTRGTVSITENPGKKVSKLTKGSSIIVPASVESYHISGQGTLYKAAVPVCDMT